MKIEKINENQIRCILTQQDLDERQLKMSELAYGSEKTQMLFQDMMQQANMDFGFEAEDTPLMIEAVPLSGEKIVLIITKVESPEELDTRFSSFTQGLADDDDMDSEEPLSFGSDLNAGEDISDFFEQLKKTLPEVRPTDTQDGDPAPTDTASPLMSAVFHFKDLGELIPAAKILKNCFSDPSALYKDQKTGIYHLVVHQVRCSQQQFRRIINVLSSHVEAGHYTDSLEAFYREHYQSILSSDVFCTLADL